MIVNLVITVDSDSDSFIGDKKLDLSTSPSSTRQRLVVPDNDERQ